MKRPLCIYRSFLNSTFRLWAYVCIAYFSTPYYCSCCWGVVRNERYRYILLYAPAAAKAAANLLQYRLRDTVWIRSGYGYGSGYVSGYGYVGRSPINILIGLRPACSVVDYTHSGVQINSVTLEGVWSPEPRIRRIRDPLMTSYQRHYVEVP